MATHIWHHARPAGPGRRADRRPAFGLAGLALIVLLLAAI